MSGPLLDEADLAFDELPAEEAERRPLASLVRTLRRGRLSHSLLFAGPPGSGKRHAAFRLAQLLACESPTPAGACRRCEACARTERGVDEGLHLLAPPVDAKTGQLKGEIPVEQVRALQERLSFRAGGLRRFAWIEPADRLSQVAQEAVLKTLEEPPPGVSLVLSTTRPNALKPTVRSRCQLVRFPVPSAEGIALVLQARGRSPAEARLAAALCGGDLRRALSLDAEEAAESWLELGRRLYEILGARGEGRARDLALELAPKGSGAAGQAEVAAGLDLLERILRDVMLAGESRAEGEDRLAERLTHPGAVPAVRALAKRLEPEAAARGLEAIAAARDELRLRMNVKVLLTGLLLDLHALARPAS